MIFASSAERGLTVASIATGLSRGIADDDEEGTAPLPPTATRAAEEGVDLFSSRLPLEKTTE